MTTTVLRETPAKWVLPFGVTLIAMFALQLSNLGFSPLLPSIQQEFGMSYTQLGLFTGIYGLLAIVLSVPAGLSANGIPFGLQVVGPRYRDDLVLDLGAAWEHARPWPASAPGHEPFPVP